MGTGKAEAREREEEWRYKREGAETQPQERKEKWEVEAREREDERKHRWKEAEAQRQEKQEKWEAEARERGKKRGRIGRRFICYFIWPLKNPMASFNLPTDNACQCVVSATAPNHLCR